MKYWLFRTNLRNLEYYHSFTTLEQFKQECHDFYLLQGIWMLENGYCEEFVVWRLAPKKGEHPKERTIIVNGSNFMQRWVDNFTDCFKYPQPNMTFFRGGFPEYGKLTRMQPNFLGTTLYCGTGKRVMPEHQGVYDKILVEDERDLKQYPGSIPFYKTANQNIFKPAPNQNTKYDICWPCNNTQMQYKGQEWFIRQVGQSRYLRSLKIVHVGNKPEMGKALAIRYRVNNITFVGQKTRHELNIILNQSRVGLVTSNMNDGCPRMLTEIMVSETPLLLRDQTRVLEYYNANAYVFREANLEKTTEHAIMYRNTDAEKSLTMDAICRKNLTQWGVINE